MAAKIDNETDPRPQTGLPVPEATAAGDWALSAAVAGAAASLLLAWRRRRQGPDLRS